MSTDPFDLIGAGHSPISCVNGLCNRPDKCKPARRCLDAVRPVGRCECGRIYECSDVLCAWLPNDP